MFSYTRLRVEQMPDVSLPFVDRARRSIRARRRRSSRSDVTKPIEYASTPSPASSGSVRTRAKAQSQVFVEFRMSTDVTRAMQDVRDKIALVRPGFPRDVKDPLVHAGRDRGQPAARGLARRAVPDGRACASSRRSPTRPSSRRWRTSPASPQVDVNGRVTRQILDPDQAHGAQRARHRRRSGDQRDPEREPGRPGGADHPRSERRDRAGRGQDQGSGAVRARHRRAAGRRPDLPVAGRRRHRRREGAGLDLAHQRAAVDHDRHPQGAGRQHRRDRRIASTPRSSR